MFRFLPGVLLAQLAAAGLLWLNLHSLATAMDWARLIVPVIVIALVIAFWFGSVSRQSEERRLGAEREAFAREREKIQVAAERARTRVVEKTQKEIRRESRRVHAQANFKVGAAVTAAVGVGVVMTFTQFVTMGLMLMVGSGLVLGAYTLRSRRRRSGQDAAETGNGQISIETADNQRLQAPRQRSKVSRLLKR